MLIFEKSQTGRSNITLWPQLTGELHLDSAALRATPLELPAVSELEVVRHYTQLSRINFSIDSHFYPLGSCTMKYNPKVAHFIASDAGYASCHPYHAPQQAQGLLATLYQLQQNLATLTGMHQVCLAPMAGAQGEFAGVAMITAYHRAHGDHSRCEMLVPDAAHGTNPASAVMCGLTVKEVPTTAAGDLDLEHLRQMVGPQTAGIMLTNPSTLGVFERQIQQIADIVHQAGGLLYYDGANLNAILGKYSPGDMGFDVVHLNLHKTFATPHGCGGPGAGPVAANERLSPFLPIPRIAKSAGEYRWLERQDCPQTIGRLSTFMGNVGVLLRAAVYIALNGQQSLPKVAEFAVLNANYLMKRLESEGFTVAFAPRRASHEFIITLKNEKKAYGITALDVAKRLLDYGFHPPTIYFPLLVPECLLIEPAETESKQEIDRFVAAMAAILQEAKTNPQHLQQAPHKLLISRLDEVKAARELNLTFVTSQ